MGWSLPTSLRANQVPSQENLTSSNIQVTPQSKPNPNTAKPKPQSKPKPESNPKPNPNPAKPKPKPDAKKDDQANAKSEDKKDNILDNIFTKWWFYVAVIVAILFIAAGIYTVLPDNAQQEPPPNVNTNYIQ